MKRLLLGIGNVACGDDGAGPEVARRLAGGAWSTIDAGTSPENVTGVVARESPDVLVLVDAARMGLPPGSVRRLPDRAADRMLASTHGLPLTFLIDRMRSAASHVVLIGIEPERVALGEGLSPPAEAAVSTVIAALLSGNIDQLPALPVPD